MSVNRQLGYVSSHIILLLYNYVYIHHAWSSNVAIVLKSVTCGWQYQLNNSFELLSLCLIMDNFGMFLHMLFRCCVTMYTYIMPLKSNVAIVLKSVTCGWQCQLNNSLELISLCVLMDNLVCSSHVISLLYNYVYIHQVWTSSLSNCFEIS